MPRRRSRRTDDDDDDDDVVRDEQLDEQEDDEEDEEMMAFEDEAEEAGDDDDDDEEEEEEEEEQERPSRSRKGRKKKKARSSKKRDDEDEEMEEENDDDEENRATNRRSKKSKSSSSAAARTSLASLAVESSDEEENGGLTQGGGDQDGQGNNMFLSQVPDASQDILPTRQADRTNLMKLGDDARQKAIGDLARAILMKALAGEPINRTQIIKEAQINTSRISSAAFEEANIVLQNTFDFSLRRVPAWMEQRMKDFPAKYKERYYLVNELDDQTNGQVCKILHGTHAVDAMEKGLLMVVLAFVFCKGEPRSDGSRWLLDKDLYRLLHSVDDNIHAEPPAPNSSNNKRSSNSRPGMTGTPDVDACLEKFGHMDYLIKIKASTNETFLNMSPEAEETSHFYALGPRAAMEIGRVQVVHFCAQIFDQEPDPAMLAEIEEMEQDDEE